jgi:arylsulfatase A-like enzyme
MNKKKIDRRRFLQTTAGGVGALSLPGMGLHLGCGKNASKPPNIIYLLTDDQRWDMLGCAGNRIIRILTGQYLRRHKINDFRTDFTDTQLANTYPMLLRQAGYRTGFIGKWGVGRTMPETHFDYWQGIPGQPKYEMQDEHGKNIHLTRMMGDQAVGFLGSCSANQPFSLSVSFKAPHVQDEDVRQFIYDPAFKSYYDGQTIPPPETAGADYFETLPGFLQDENSIARERWQIRFSTPEKYQEMVKGYYGLITGVDVVVGRIRETLANLGFADNTVIIFSGDNGFYLGEHGFAGKWYGHEESIRVPLLFYDPRLDRSRRGQVPDAIALNIDIAPTITELAGIGTASQFQGKSLLPLIHGKIAPWRDDFLYEHLFVVGAPSDNPGGSRIARSEGVVTMDWKYLRYIDQEPVYEELYDLKADPRETTNLATVQKYQTRLSELRARCDELCKMNE